MKKFLLSALFSLLSSLGVAFGYSSTDVENANYLADQGIINYQSEVKNYRLDSTITRAEAMKIALKIKGVEIPSNYTCRKYFSDVTKHDWICAAVETAANEGIITRANAKFRPSDTITRAEALKTMMQAGSIKLDEYTEHSNAIADATDWQLPYIFTANQESIIDVETKMKGCDGGRGCLEFIWYPNQSASRSTVFNFTKNILVQNQQKGCKTCNKSYDGFSANFAGRFRKYIDESGKNINYSFGDRGELHYGIMYRYSLEVVPSAGIAEMLTKNVSSTLQKKQWNGFSYYVGELDGLFPGGVLVFYGDKQTIIVDSKLGNIAEAEKGLKSINFMPTMPEGVVDSGDVLSTYYSYLNLSEGYYMLSPAYSMRSPTGVSLESFQSWYKDVTAVNFREDTMKDLGNNTYEFLVDMTENGVTSTYKVKSKVDVENFTIDNISSQKQ